MDPPCSGCGIVNLYNKQILPPLGPVRRFHLYDEELAKSEDLTSNPHIIPLSAPTLCTLWLHRIWVFNIS